MKELCILDDMNYNDCIYHNIRIAIRGIIFINDKVVMIKSGKFGEYKFPGGGQEIGEDHLTTLKREVKEETGLVVLSETISEFGSIREKRKSIYNDNELFEQNSYYYLCKVDPYKKEDTNYTEHEIEYGYHYLTVDLDKAYKNNLKIISMMGKKANFIKRETIVIERLIKMKNDNLLKN